MTSDLELAATLRAWETGRPQTAARRLQTVLRQDALVLVALKMAGEDTTVHVVAYGRPGGPATIDFVSDPRYRDDQYALFERLGDVVEQYYAWCRERDSYPQIVLPADPNSEHLD